MRQRSRRDDLAGCEWRIDLIARENIDEMTQCRNRSTQQIRSATVIKDRAVALQIDFEGRKRPAPILGMRCDGVTRPDKQGSMQPKGCDCVRRGKLPSGKDRLHDFENVRNPVDARQQRSLSETYERERIADRGEVVYGAIVNISPDRFVYVVFSPNRTISESNLSSHGHLAAGLAHLSHCGGYAVRIVEIERRNPRGKWLDLTASIEGAEHLGSNCLNAH